MNLLMLFLFVFAAPLPMQSQPYAATAPGHFTVRLVAQENVWDYVPNSYGQASLFSRPMEQYGTLGLLAHNYLSGQEFYNLKENDTILLGYSDRIATYKVVRIYQFPAVTNTTQEWEIYNTVYSHGNLVLQTCLNENGFFFVESELVSSRSRK